MLFQTTLRSYPAYKPSGVPWLGDVPAHWEVRRLGELHASVASGTWGEEPTGVGDIVCVRVADFDRLQLRAKIDNPTMRHVACEELARKGLAKGDLLLEKSGGGDLQPVGMVVLFDNDVPAVCTNFIARLKPADICMSKYALAVHSTLYAMRVNVQSIKQTTGIQNLDLGAYFSEIVPLPPLHEQAAIVRYLDLADELINRYVSAKERLIALLEEERQAVIHQAVTRGLDPNAPLKPSGVEWLGEVPRHWTVRRLRTLADIATGSRDTINSVENGAYPFFVRSQNVERINSWSFDGEAVLTAGDGVGVGRVFHYINGKFDYHQRVYKFSHFTDITGKLFYPESTDKQWLASRDED